MIAENEYFSFNLGPLPRGCQYCVRGEKLVLFVTGICPRRCYFCPLSDQKYGHDISFANERLVSSEEDIITEAMAMNAKGAGLTGGDPLAKIERTAECIKKLKQKFGKNFHIHLYTSLTLATTENLQRLFEAGLDEIRFHMDLDSEQHWPRIELAQQYSWDIGVEIPSIPGKETALKKVVDFIANKVSFLNLNELERADNSISTLDQMGFKTINALSYAISGSPELGLTIIDYVQEKGYSLSVHLCTAKLKDRIQLANRLKRESGNVKKEFDHVDQEGLLTRGAAYLPELAPGFEYRKKLETVDKRAAIEKLKPIFEMMKKELQLRDNSLYLDISKPRLLFSRKSARIYAKWLKKQGLVVAIVKEYPTADQLEIEVDFLNK